MSNVCRAFAPATAANLGPGFDVLGAALQGAGDTVSVSLASDTRIQIRKITGDNGQLPLNPNANTAAIAARATLKRAGVNVGLVIDIDKGLPIGSGLGSSAASAVAAAIATNGLIGSPLRAVELIEPCLEAEAEVSGRHADNVAPALLGGVVLVRSLDPVDVIRITAKPSLTLVVVTPKLSVSTKAARAVISETVSIGNAVTNSANLAALILGLQAGDVSLISRSLVDQFSTPSRIHLVPGGEQAISSALHHGALGAAMSGAGPSIFALCSSRVTANRCLTRMIAAFESAGQTCQGLISPLNAPGARIV